MTIELLMAVLGWCSILNMGVLIFATIFLTLFGGFTKRIHSKLLNIPEEQLAVEYFKYLGNYKIAIFVLNLAPYLALRIVMS